MKVLTYVGLDTSKVKKQFQKVKSLIEQGDFRSPDVKKLTQGNYHRAKLDDTNRLLLTFMKHQGETVCLALEVIHRHRYEKSRFLRGAVVDETKIVDTTFEDLQGDLPALKYVNPAATRFHLLDKVISFDDLQNEVYQTRPPLIVVGSAGSGKTALTLEKLKQITGNVLYVTLSPYLAQSARDLYFSQGFEPVDQEPLFLSYREFLETLQVPEGREVTFQAFQGWFQGHRQTYRFTDAHQLFEEIRGVITSRETGTLSRQDYLELGVKQSIYPAEHRSEVYALFEKYRVWLGSSGFFDPNLVSFEWQKKAQPTFDFVVVDEVQDFTRVQLALVLRTLKTRGQFLLCGDSNQIVHPNFFSWSAVKSLFWEDEELALGQQFSVLKVNFRNAQEVTRTANTLLKIKHRRFGSVDRESNFLVESAIEETGRVECLPDRDPVKKALNEQIKGSTEYAVLVLREEDKLKARQHFQTPLVFSVHEAKGLEYPHIVLYNFVSLNRQDFLEIVEGVTKEDLQVETLTYKRGKDKTDKSLEIYKFYINALYVAVTRATESVLLIEGDQNHPLLNLLDVQVRADLGKLNTRAASREEWEKEAARLELQGKQEQADRIRSEVLKVKKVPWEVWNEENITALKQKAFDPKNTSNKASRALMDYAVWTHDHTLLRRLGTEGKLPLAAGLYPPQISGYLEGHPYAEVPEKFQQDILKFRKGLFDRHLTNFSGKNFKSVLWDCDNYGVDYRTPVNWTPLMVAAYQGNIPLLDTLLERGARVHLTDACGQTAFLIAVGRALTDREYASGPFGEVYSRLAPSHFDVQVEGRLIRIDRQMGEYFPFVAMLSLLPQLPSTLSSLSDLPKRKKGFFAPLLSSNVDVFSEQVLREERRKRTYFNHVLARAEVESTYTPARKLWVRTGHGLYMPNPEMQVRVKNLQGEEVWKPVLDTTH